MSTGPNLLIEFEASSKKTTFGFSGMYRFTEFGNESDYDNEGIYNFLLNFQSTLRIFLCIFSISQIFSQYI